MVTPFEKRWLASAVAFLGAGGGFALLIALSRTPQAHVLFPEGFMYQGIVGHVVLAIVMWLMSFCVVLWGRFLGGCGVRSSHLAAIAGAVMVTTSVLAGDGMAVVNNYVPTIDSPLFFAGLGLFFASIAVNAVSFLRPAVAIIMARESATARGAVALSVVTALVFFASLLASLALNPEEPHTMRYFERLFWIPGHIQQVLNGALLMAVWYALADALGRPASAPARLMTAMNMTLLLSALALFVVPFVVDPLSPGAKAIAEGVYAVGLGVPLFAHAVNILWGIGGWGRTGRAGVTLLALLLSMAIYFMGVAIAYTGLGNDLRVPAHYHGAVTGLTLGMMGIAIGLMLGGRARAQETRRGLLERLASVQPALYGSGMILVISGLMVSGMMGAPRKTFGVAFASEPALLMALSVMGMGTLMAVTGGVLFVSYCGVRLAFARNGGKNLDNDGNNG